MTNDIIEILTGGEESPPIMSIHLLGDYLGHLRRPAVRAAILAEDGSDDAASYDQLLADVEIMHRRLVAIVGVDDRGRPLEPSRDDGRMPT